MAWFLQFGAALTAGGAALLLAGCSGGTDAPAEDAPSAATAKMEAAAASTAELRPGRYQNQIEIVRLEVPGLPPEARAEMQRQFASATATVQTSCLTAEAAQRGREQRLSDLARAQGQCRMQEYSVDGDQVRGEIRCSALPGGGTASITMRGTLGAESSDLTIATTAANPAAPAQNIVTEMRVRSTRVGECQGNEPGADMAR
ncbi:MAG: DUF3617 domain-containing protein [Sphingopyxis sp.]|nr:DUF3617 domain-containing protein [Sphingopyxis sp.]